MLPVNEIFETLQGEATFTGTPSVFIRLQGCEVGCPWCDTKHTWQVDPAQAVQGLQDILLKDEDGPSYALISPADLAKAVTVFRSRHVVITGGEPCRHDLSALVDWLISKGRTVQIETSGTEDIQVPLSAWVTLSPKIDMPGGRRVLHDAVARADEIKMPVGKTSDVKKLVDFINEHDFKGPVWLQPLSRSQKATSLCIEAASEFGFRVSIQTHHLLGLR